VIALLRAWAARVHGEAGGPHGGLLRSEVRLGAARG
jgi:hypothetical protein